MLLLFFFLFCHSTIRVAVFLNLKQYLVAGLCMVLIFLFLFCHPTIRFAVLLQFQTMSICWTWYGIDFLCIFNLTEQWESPCYQTIKQYQVAGLGIVPCYQTLKQYQVAGLGMLLMFLFVFYHPTIRVTMLLIWNNIQLLDLVWYWYFFSFFVNPLWESPCY